MTLRLFLLILGSVSLSALAQMCLKAGTSRPDTNGAESAVQELTGLLQSPLVYLGLGLYGLGAILWLFVLARVPLSLAYPFVGIGFILTAAAGAVVFQENLNVTRIAGTMLIAAGCVLVARSA